VQGKKLSGGLEALINTAEAVANRRETRFNMAVVIRTFICLEVPAEDRAKIGDLQTELRSHGARVSWTNPASIHLTLAFLGDVEEARLTDIAVAVKEAVAEARSFHLRIEGTGGFPSLDRPRVLWVGVAGDLDDLAAIQQRLQRGLERLGFPREQKRFTPHLTIGRVKDVHDPALAAIARTLRQIEVRGAPFGVNEIILMRSDLGTAGPRYTPLARAVIAT
jgi:2'-5' RNA ligase